MAAPDVVLVIGVHREELAFGERVAEELNPQAVAVLRIPEGISGRRPRPDERFYYEARHREIYLQLLPQVKGRFRLMIDLHTGIDQFGRCADVYCGDAVLLSCIEQAVTSHSRGDEAVPAVRIVPLMPREQRSARRAGESRNNEPFGETIIPPSVWDSEAFIYVGLEIYLTEDGAAGSPGDWAFAKRLVEAITGCAGA